MAVIVGTNGPDILFGTSGDDTITGLGANDQLYGYGGNNQLDGGTGIDTADYSAATGSVVLNLATAVASSNGYGGHDNIVNIETVVGSATAFNDLTGTSLVSEYLIGGSANDDFNDGGAGAADTLQGGAGDDYYDVHNSGDSIVEFSGQGTDTVYAEVSSFVLPANVENLFNGTGGDFVGTGNALNNLLSGGRGAGTQNDTLNGGDGNDQLFGYNGNNILNGGNGIDTVDYSTFAVTGVNVNLATGVVSNNGEGGSDTVSSIETVVGTNFADVLTGDTNSNYLIGLFGDDTLTGGSGAANTLQGGVGNDTYIVSAVGDSIVEFAGQGTDIVQTDLSSFTLPSNVENLTYTGAGAFTGAGNFDNNIIIGSTGADYLIGSGGDDVLVGHAGAANALQGGTGNDTYAVEVVGDTVTEFAGEGFDQVETNLSSYTLSANVEQLIFTGAGNFAGTGNSGDNVIIGALGNDTLTGLIGNDTLTGGEGPGADTFVFTKGDGLDVVTDFQPGSSAGDVIDLTGYGISSFAALQPFMSQVGNNTLIAFDASNHITLNSVQMANLNAGDFVFH